VVALLQGAVLLTFAVTPTRWLPKPGDVWSLIWAYFHQPQFYPLLALMVGGPVLTAVAWSVRGRHRAILVITWVVFTAALFYLWRERVVTMLYVVWRLIQDM